MGIIYFRSAFVKLNNWENTVMLFEYEYKTLLLSPAVAAFLSTSVELICPILLFIGLFTRLAVLPMLVVVLVIQYTYLDLKEHYYWVILLSFLLCYGSGYFSCDRIIRNCFIIK
ncbi:DoxX family protein [Candidatus Xenohaliotis californiensis]